MYKIEPENVVAADEYVAENYWGQILYLAESESGNNASP